MIHSIADSEGCFCFCLKGGSQGWGASLFVLCPLFLTMKQAVYCSRDGGLALRHPSPLLEPPLTRGICCDVNRGGSRVEVLPRGRP